MAQHIDRDFKTILLTWNPKKWAWESLPEMAEETAREGTCIDSWSVSHTKDIRPGDRFFLLHVGTEPRGIMASGAIISEPESKPHWDGSERSALFVEIEYDRLFPPDQQTLPLKELKKIAPRQHWTPQSSGTQLREEYVEAVERAWFAHSPSSGT